MDANLEKMKACLEVTEACLGNMETMIRAGQKQMGIKIMTGLDEMKATVRTLSRGHCGAL
jgi:hypothetical protein